MPRCHPLLPPLLSLLLLLLPAPLPGEEHAPVPPPPAEARHPPLVFSGLQGSSVGPVVEEVLTRAYAALGIPIRIQRMPGQRALLEAAEGRWDGAELRVAGVAQRHPTLLQAPVPVFETEVRAFTKGLTFPVTGWESLRPYRVAAPGGYTAILSHLDGIPHWVVPNYQQMFRMLDAGRVDVAVVDLFNGEQTIHREGLRGIHPLPGGLRPIIFYHFLHQKNRPLLAPITRQLRAMYDSGEITAIRRAHQRAAEGMP